MNARRLFLLAAVVVTPLLYVGVGTPQSADPSQREAARPAPPAREPHNPAPQKPPERAVPRPPESKPSEKAEPRGPSRESQHAVPRPPERWYGYPRYHPDSGLGFYYGFPYGPYPYWRMYPPYGYPQYPWWWWTDEFDAYGSVRLSIPQTDAGVYVDGFYVGIVADFDGVLQHLNLSAGPHRIEVRLEGFESLSFSVYVEPGRTITYRGALRPAS